MRFVSNKYQFVYKYISNISLQLCIITILLKIRPGSELLFTVFAIVECEFQAQLCDFNMQLNHSLSHSKHKCVVVCASVRNQ